MTGSVPIPLRALWRARKGEAWSVIDPKALPWRAKPLLPSSPKAIRAGREYNRVSEYHGIPAWPSNYGFSAVSQCSMILPSFTRNISNHVEV